MAVTQRVGGRPRAPGSPAIRNPYSVLPDWVYPTFVVVMLSAFSLYAAWIVLFQVQGRFGPYLSPFYSPEISVRLGRFLIPPALWVVWAPLAFRATCYYYRKAYFRSFFWHPRSCAVPDHPGQTTRYRGETGFWALNNLHRFAFYAIVVQMCFLWYEALAQLAYRGAWHFGLGSAIMLVNVLALSGYSFGCHSLRHLVGGDKDCFSCHRARQTLWKGVTVLNVRHDRWAWVSLFTVVLTDVYIRLLITGVIPPAAWV